MICKSQNEPAFPRPYSEAEINGVNHLAPAFPGMSSRDWFAGQALVGISENLARMIATDSNATGIAIGLAVERSAALSYEIADAMLTARSKGDA